MIRFKNNVMCIVVAMMCMAFCACGDDDEKKESEPQKSELKDDGRELSWTVITYGEGTIVTHYVFAYEGNNVTSYYNEITYPNVEMAETVYELTCQVYDKSDDVSFVKLDGCKVRIDFNLGEGSTYYGLTVEEVRMFYSMD